MFMETLTLVTGILNIGRGQLGFPFYRNPFRRPFGWYIENFRRILQINLPMVIHIQKKYEPLVWEYRSEHNTRIVRTEIEDLKKFPYYAEVQKIRKSSAWRGQAEWLRRSPQAALANYNPLVMSKVLWLAQAAQLDSFKTPYAAWIDGAVARCFSADFTDQADSILPGRLAQSPDRLLFLSYVHTEDQEIHGFDRKACAKYCGTDFVDCICRGGFFGGRRELIQKMAGHYEAILGDTLKAGFMGTEETLLTILSYRYPELFRLYMLHWGPEPQFFTHISS